MPVDSHPSDERLSDYLEGRLPIEEIDSLAEHLSGCDACRDRVESIEREGLSLVGRLRAAEATVHRLPEACLHMMEAAERLAETPPTASNDGASSEPDSSQASEYHPDSPTIDYRTNPDAETITGAERVEDGSLPIAPRVGGGRSAAFAPGETFGDYEILEEIARGGMGVVFRARHVGLDRTVALKMILDSRLASDESVHRFRTEAAAAARLDHAGIVPVYDVGEINGQQFFTMRLVEGGSLKDLAEAEALEPRRAATILSEISRTVQFAHTRNIVHRDLKPANVLLDETGRPRLTDFGLAKDIAGDSDMTDPGQVMGTPTYMAPEQAAGRSFEVGPLSDVYSLGAILYRLLTGRPPFVEDHVLKTLRAVIHDEPVPPRKRNPEIDLDLATICTKCLQKDPALRYTSAAELADDLDRYLRDEPIEARPISLGERMMRWFRRNPRVTYGLVATIAVMAAAVVYAGVGLDRAVRDHQATLEGISHQSLEETARWVAGAAQRELSAKFRQTQIAADNGDLRELLEEFGDGVRDYGAAKAALDAWNRQGEAYPGMKPEELPLEDFEPLPEDLRPLQDWVSHNDGWVEHGLVVERDGKIGPGLWKDIPDEYSENVLAWWVCGPDGFQVARDPIAPKGTRNFAYRSYFSGLPTDTDPEDPPEPSWTRTSRPRLSAVFCTRDTDHWVVAISAPVWGDPPSAESEEPDRPLGVVGMFVEVGDLLPDPEEESEARRVAVLLEPFGDRRSAQIIEHAYHCDARSLDSEVLWPDVATATMTREEWEAPIGVDPFGGAEFGADDEFGGRWRSAWAPVPLEEGADLIALVREPVEIVDGPSRRLRANLRALGIAVIGLFLLPPLIALWLLNPGKRGSG